MVAFVIWCLVGCFFVVLGIYARFAKKEMGFWANAKVLEATDRKKYNRAMSILYICFGLIFIVLGLPLLAGQNSPWIILTIFGVMIESIGVMAVYTLVIEKKFKKR